MKNQQPMKPETIARRRAAREKAATERSQNLRARMVEKIATGKDPDGIWAEMLAEFDAARALKVTI